MIRRSVLLLAAAIAAAALAACVTEEQAIAQRSTAGTPVFATEVRTALAPLPAGCTQPQHQAFRGLASANVSRVRRLCDLGTESQEHLRRYMRSSSVKAVWLPHRRLCRQAPKHNQQWADRCYLVRQHQLRPHIRRLIWVRRMVAKLTSLPWMGDLALTSGRRACIALVETKGSSHPYTQQQNGNGDHWGKYQYSPGTWQTVSRAAAAYYHVNLPLTSRADLAPGWEQEVVTAFALLHPKEAGRPWVECQ